MKIINYLLIIGTIILSLFIVSGCNSSTIPDRNFSRNPKFNSSIVLDSEIDNIFSQDLDSVNFYCSENMSECLSYCKITRSSHEFCVNLENNFPKGERLR